jgi:hypothetical protein
MLLVRYANFDHIDVMIYVCVNVCICQSGELLFCLWCHACFNQMFTVEYIHTYIHTYIQWPRHIRHQAMAEEHRSCDQVIQRGDAKGTYQKAYIHARSRDIDVFCMHHRSTMVVWIR